MAKVKVKINNLDKALARIKKDILDTTERSNILNEAGDLAVKAIQAKTRSGQTMAQLDSNGRATRLPGLSRSYIDYRKGKVSFYNGKQGQTYAIDEKSPKLKDVDPQFFRPTLANNTFTGQLLRAIKYRIINNVTFEVFVANTRREGDDLTNKEVADFLAENGRSFLGLDAATLGRIKNLWLRAYRRKIKK